MTTQLTITRPDDWHLHLRDGELMASVVAHTAREFARAIVMPNLKPPVSNVEMAAAYRERILAALPAGSDFQPLMTLYLTGGLTPNEVVKAKNSGFVHAVKLYPAGATTNSEAGVAGLDGVMPTLEKMAEIGLPFLVHGEVTDPAVDVFDREAAFIDQVMAPLLLRLPTLRVVFEHITTRQAAEFVASAGDNVAATITPQHLLMNRNALFQGGIRPHHYCLPVLKREEHRRALVAAVASGSNKFFLGTDSAPHALHTKEAACGCAGIYSAHAALAFYAEAFEAAGALDKLEAFASFNGPDFYRLPRNTGTVTLVKESWTVPASYPFGEHSVVPLRAGEQLGWKLL
ncbi:Dihydroorotase [Andreprevotia sp. IGB-42]|uniref:dihydroorotase n=1 Tax=Andreprevotia sp. IGB-42 TaxID=2497473 RepID=UPI001358961E|nr:dihydroorotase [Andreprevotia sp. IGB-42]KAF0812401.1 Dihydroorotase [Andreprevotia sp. IGB-42]